MKLLYKLEKKFGRYAIKNLSLYMVICFSIGYLLLFLFPDIYTKLLFSPALIFANHEYWRIFTWIFTVPGSFQYVTILLLFAYYFIGNSIERSIGTFLYNVYIIGGAILTTIGMLISGAIFCKEAGVFAQPEVFVNEINSNTYLTMAFSNIWPTYYIVTGIYLCFGYIFKDSYLMLAFLIPVRARYIMYIDLIWLAYEFYVQDMQGRTVIVCLLISFMLLILVLKKYNRNGHRMTSAQIKRRKEYQKKVKENEKVIQMPGVSRHKCAICGKTEKDDFEMEFRFCSKCNGNYEYCSEHLYTHEHVK